MGSRHLIVLFSAKDRDRAYSYIKQAPIGTRVEFKAAKRTIDQSNRMWACLTDIAAQKEHFGRKYPPDIWKLIFLNALGREMQFVPSLDGKTVVPCGQSSSDLSREEMGELLSLIDAWGAENGIKFHGPENRLA